MLSLSLTGIWNSYIVYHYPDLSFFLADLGGVHPVLPCWWREGSEPGTGEGPSVVVFSHIPPFFCLSFSPFSVSRWRSTRRSMAPTVSSPTISDVNVDGVMSHTHACHTYSARLGATERVNRETYPGWDNFRLGRRFQAGIKCDNMLYWQRNISRQRASRWCWVNEKEWTWEEGSMQRQSLQAGERSNSISSSNPGWENMKAVLRWAVTLACRVLRQGEEFKVWFGPAKSADGGRVEKWRERSKNWKKVRDRTLLVLWYPAHREFL